MYTHKSSRAKKGLGTLVGMAFLISLIIASFLFLSSLTKSFDSFISDASSEGKISRDIARIDERSLIHSVGFDEYIPKSFTISGGGSLVSGDSLSLSNNDDKDYLVLKSTQGNFALVNENFTGIGTAFPPQGWSVDPPNGTVNDTTTITYGTDSTDDSSVVGGSGPSSIFVDINSTPTTNTTMIQADMIYTFTYTQGEPNSAKFSWARHTGFWTAIGQTATLSAILVEPDNTETKLDGPIILTTTTDWILNTNSTVNTSLFSQSGTYKLILRFETTVGLTILISEIKQFYDDVGISLNGQLVDLKVAFNIQSYTSEPNLLEVTLDTHYNDTIHQQVRILDNINSIWKKLDSRDITSINTDLQLGPLPISEPFRYNSTSGEVNVRLTAFSTNTFISYIDQSHLKILPTDNGFLIAELTSEGSTTVKFVKIWVTNSTSPSSNSTIAKQFVITDGFVKAGEIMEVIKPLDFAPVRGSPYQIKLITERGNVITSVIKA